ncbi:thiamine pyrophosphate-binding protein [Roseiarcaceae bacterium H3SJ34-1]|uniref:thiamine pyrophosphate-binding protein n=1 Tax=Terripilifer ovatus TaxID=3032367 RepID=UPI003AB960A4|nr:thiamine pyrophosphate-binding protein [Roseiarcaceae bacterium H3SJ34-1]
MTGPVDGVPTNRRNFLRGAALAGAAPALATIAPAQAAVPAAARPLPSALPPTAQRIAAEVGNPEAEGNRIGGKAGSDFMVDVIKTLDIKYTPSNCASSFRGLHESLINYGENKSPEYLSCTHEESGVGMAHGYFKITGKPLMTMVHGTVGLQHATMGIYNAFCDRVPVIIIAGNDLDAAYRPPGVPTFHSAQDINAIIRDYTKWDDTPVSPQAFALTMVRGYKVAMTPPFGPVSISLDAGIQQEPLSEHHKDLYIPKFTMPSPPAGEMGAVKEAARLLVNAENPVIIADRSARTAEGVGLLVQLAELLQAPVVDQGNRMNFPNTHYLSRAPGVISTADVILGLELSDFWGTVNAYSDNGVNGIGENGTKIKKNTKLISINASELITKSNYQDFQRFQPVDIAMPADAQATLPALIEAVKSALTADQKRAIEGRIEKAKKAHADARNRELQTAAIAWDASPISTARLCMETWAAIKDQDWSLVASEGNVSNWPNRLWKMEKHHHWIGRSGGYGVGYGAPASVGAALANRDLGRFSVSIQSDGDLMFAPGVLWTAARHKIPLLSVMHNNRAWHQEVMHVQRMASFRDRASNYGNDLGPIGTSIMNPDIEYHKLAESMGWWAKGPIKDPADLGPALKEAVAVVKSGQPALLNVWTQPR